MIYWPKDPSEGDVVRGKREYMVVESLVVQEVHSVVHGSSDMESGRNSVVGMRFEGI